MTRFAELLGALVKAEVRFILIGGVAAAAHGSPRATQDLDIVYRRNPSDLDRLLAALSPHAPYLRGAPPGLPFRFDVATLRYGWNFTLTTELGWLDLSAEIPGGGRYEDLLPFSLDIEVFGFRCRVLDLEALIRTKRAAGRPKDFEAVAELEAIRDRTDSQ